MTAGTNAAGSAALRAIAGRGKPAKYRSRRVTVHGETYDSKREAARAAELRLLERAGEIADLQRQVKYVLQAGFRHRGKAYREIAYVADFVYHEKGSPAPVVEDTKSPITRINPVYRLKLKLLLARYPEIEFRES